METQLCAVTAESVAYAARILREDGVVAIPTETVYGLAANALSDAAVKKIFEAKGRPQDNPLISHISSLDMLPLIASDVPDAARRLAEAFWPGPLTMILPRGGRVADSVCAGLGTAAVRMPSHPAARAVIEACGFPLAAPSANLSGSPSPTTAADVLADMNGRIPLILDGGASDVGVESTVVSLTGAAPMLLRPGRVTKEQLEQVLGTAVELSGAVVSQLREGEIARSPGMKYKHYAPKAQVTLVRGTPKAFAAFVNQRAVHEPEVTAMCFDGEEAALKVPFVTYGRRDNAADQAQHLFDTLRELDDRGAKRVYAACPSEDGVGLAVYNRLLRAAGFEVIDLD